MNQKEILELKSTLTVMKNSIEGFKSRFEQKEETICEFKDMIMKIIKSEEQKEQFKKNKA